MTREELEPILARLRAADPSPLVPSKARDAGLDRTIAALKAASDPERAVQSALHLWNDSLVAAHELAQEIHTTTGSLIHGVMHRREPDYANAKYWFHKVGAHALFPAFRRAALERLPDLIHRYPAWDAFHMVDCCERAAADSALEASLRPLQAAELDLLAARCVDEMTR